MKNQETPSGIEPAAFRFVAIHAWTVTISRDAVISDSSDVIADLSYPRHNGNVPCFVDDLVRILAGP
jgi:hypothetical protein